MKLKKLASVAMAGVMAVSLAACGGSDTAKTTAADATTAAEAETTAAAETVAESTGTGMAESESSETSGTAAQDDESLRIITCFRES